MNGGQTKFDEFSTIEFDENRPISQLRSSIWPQNSSTRFAIQFLDSNGVKISEYSPCFQTDFGPIIKIGVNEECIGIYGSINSNNKITSFGFIVKVKQF